MQIHKFLLIASLVKNPTPPIYPTTTTTTDFGTNFESFWLCFCVVMMISSPPFTRFGSGNRIQRGLAWFWLLLLLLLRDMGMKREYSGF